MTDWAFIGSHFPTLPSDLPADTPTGPGSFHPISWPLTGAGETICKVEDQWKTLEIAGTGTVTLTGSVLGGDTISRPFDIVDEQGPGGDDWDGLLFPEPNMGGRVWNMSPEAAWEIDISGYSSGLGPTLELSVVLSLSLSELFVAADGTYTKTLGVAMQASWTALVDVRIERTVNYSAEWLVGGAEGGIDAGPFPVLGSSLPFKMFRQSDYAEGVLNIDLTFSAFSVTVTERFAAPPPLP